MTDFWKMVLSFLVLAVLVVFAVEMFFFFKHGYFIAIRDLFRLILGR
jgi:hypothetical protein